MRKFLMLLISLFLLVGFVSAQDATQESFQPTLRVGEVLYTFEDTISFFMQDGVIYIALIKPDNQREYVQLAVFAGEDYDPTEVCIVYQDGSESCLDRFLTLVNPNGCVTFIHANHIEISGAPEDPYWEVQNEMNEVIHFPLNPATLFINERSVPTGFACSTMNLMVEELNLSGFYAWPTSERLDGLMQFFVDGLVEGTVILEDFYTLTFDGAETFTVVSAGQIQVGPLSVSGPLIAEGSDTLTFTHELTNGGVNISSYQDVGIHISLDNTQLFWDYPADNRIYLVEIDPVDENFQTYRIIDSNGDLRIDSEGLMQGFTMTIKSLFHVREDLVVTTTGHLTDVNITNGGGLLEFAGAQSYIEAPFAPRQLEPDLCTVLVQFGAAYASGVVTFNVNSDKIYGLNQTEYQVDFMNTNQMGTISTDEIGGRTSFTIDTGVPAEHEGVPMQVNIMQCPY